jgi:hypothetical protein
VFTKITLGNESMFNMPTESYIATLKLTNLIGNLTKSKVVMSARKIIDYNGTMINI